MSVRAGLPTGVNRQTFIGFVDEIGWAFGGWSCGHRSRLVQEVGPLLIVHLPYSPELNSAEMMRRWVEGRV